jgi:2,4-dienoyl-CoA reductase (NADPH2)
MPTDTHSDLLSRPLDLGPRTMANRIVQAPLSVCYAAADGTVTPKLIEHYQRRAAGGAAMVITESVAVSPLGRQLPLQALIAHERQLPGLAALAEAIQLEGALAVIQLVHTGRYAGPWEHYERERRLAPSAVEFELLPGRRVTPHEITAAEIADTIEAFADATRLARRAGFDGVEIHGAQGFLISSFQSPRMNQRADAYGVDRHRFAEEVVEAVVEAAGDDLLVGYHLFSDEMMPEGHLPADAVSFVQRLNADGVHFVIPIPTTFESLRARRIEEPEVDPTAYSPEVAAALAEVTDIPLFGNGGLGDVDVAEAVLAEGDVQAVALGRALFTDPDWPRKALSGDAVRTCACSPPTCLRTQLTGSICHSWPQEIQDQGYWGTADLLHPTEA